VTSVLAKRMRPHSADFLFKNVFGRIIRRKSALPSGILFASTEVKHTPRSDFPLLSILRTHTKFVRKNEMLALGVCFPKLCSSDDRKFAASRSRLNHNTEHLVCFHENEFNEMLCKLDCSEFARSFEQTPTLA